MSQVEKRILLIQDRTEPLGGKEAVFAWVLDALSRQYDVTVLSWNSSIGVIGLNDQCGSTIEASSFRVKRPSSIFRFLRHCILTFERDPASIQPAMLLMRVAKSLRHDYDLCIGCEMESDMGKPGLQYIHYPWLENFAGSMERNDRLGTWHGLCAVLRQRSRPWMAVGNFSYKQMCGNRTLTNSDWTGRRIREAYGIEATTLYPPGAGIFPAIPWNKRLNGFVCIGRIHPVKRIDWLIESLRPLRTVIPNLHLHIVGKTSNKPDEKVYVKALQKRVSIEREWITLYLDIPRADLATLAAQQRYGLHAMVDEHFGMAIAEMVRAGCIPFVHNSGGAVEIVDREARLLYDTHEELQARILDVVHNAEIQSELLQKLKIGADRFTPESFQRGLLTYVASCFKDTETFRPAEHQ